MNSNDGFSRDLGAQILGPFLRSYVLWLHEAAKRDGIERLVFLARDGYVMQQVYRIVIPVTEQIPNQYMYASRRLFNVAAIEELNDRVLRFLTSDRIEMPVRLYLQRIGLDALDCDALLEEFGFNDGQNTIVRPHMVNQLRRFFVAIEPQILEHVRAERTKLLEYADGVADWSGEKCAVVDIGWHGTLQESLSKVLGLEPRSLHGYYLGLERSARRDRDQPMRAYLEESRLSDYLFYRLAVNRCVDLYELLLSEMGGSIVALERVKGGFAPVREAFDARSDQNRAISRLQQALLERVARMNSRVRAHRLRSWLPMVRLLSFPTIYEAKQLGNIFQRSGFGGYGEVGYLALPLHSRRTYLLHPWLYVAELRRSYWRRAFALRVLTDRHKR